MKNKTTISADLLKLFYEEYGAEKLNGLFPGLFDFGKGAEA